MSAFNGSGTFVISGSGLPFVTGTPISSTVANQLNTDLATGLSTTVTKDGQTTTTAIIPFAVGLKTDTLSPYTAGGPVSLSAGQLTFPAVQNPSTNANTLDDYEEGNWTPADASGASLSITVNSAKYVKIGKFVFLTAGIVYPVTGSGASSLLSGLPFSMDTAAYSTGSMQALAGFAGAVPIALISSTTMRFDFQTGVPMTNSQLSGQAFVFSLHYIAAA